MSNNRQFDDHIKDQFGSYEPDVHPRIWENIVAARQKRRPAGIWLSLFNSRIKLMVAGLFIALSTGGAWVYFNRTFNNSSTQTSIETTKTNQGTDNKKSGAGDVTAPAPLNDLLENNNAESATANTTENSNHAISTPGGLKATIIKPSVQQDDINNTVVDKYKNRNKNKYTGLGSVLVNTTSPGVENDENEFQGQGTLLGRLNYNAEKYALEQKNRKKEKLDFNPVVYFPDCPSFEKDAAGNKKYFEFYAGPDYAIRSLHDTANSAYLQKRKESTSFQSAYSAGLRYTRVFNNGMSVRGGVNFSQINEKFKYAEGNVIQIIHIINANGDTIGTYSTVGTRYKTTINRYRSIDIPLTVGYELGNGKWHANINAGAVVNVYSWQKGDILDTAGRPVSITTGKGSSPYQFKTNAGVGFIAAVSVYYKLNDRLHLMAEPYFRYNLSPMNKENITLKQKYQTAGLRVGIRLDIK